MAAGTSREANIPMMLITTNISTSVKPRRKQAIGRSSSSLGILLRYCL
jgi:hypothetical protein